MKNCPTCRAEYADDATSCTACGQPFDSPPIEIRTSGLAISSVLLATLVPLLCFFLTQLPWVGVLLAGFGMIAPALAMVLGIASLVQIWTSGGKLNGTGYASLGIFIPLLVMGIPCLLAILHLRQSGLAFRMTCGTNLSRIGKAMLIYAHEYDGKLPQAGGENNLWAQSLPAWYVYDRQKAYGLDSSTTQGRVTPQSSLYLLVKYAEVTPHQFNCRANQDVSIFRLSDIRTLQNKDATLIDLWDFGPHPQEYCSYTYHWPFDDYALTTDRDPALAIAADRNPWLINTEPEQNTWDSFLPDNESYQGRTKDARMGNSPSHHSDGQNVLFLDSHVAFEKRSFCGVNDDNIYTPAGNADPNATSSKGLRPVRFDMSPSNRPKSKRDSYLVQ